MFKQTEKEVVECNTYEVAMEVVVNGIKEKSKVTFHMLEAVKMSKFIIPMLSKLTQMRQVMASLKFFCSMKLFHPTG